MSPNIPEHLQGLTNAQVQQSREKFGSNQLESMERATFWNTLIPILKEPMLLLLFTVSLIYLLVGDYGEALFMFFAIVAVSAISFFQDNRSRKALEALEKLNEPLSTVIRNGKVIQIPTHELVVGDLSIVEEGRTINADGKIVHSNDFSVNESSLTGESFSVFKNRDPESNQVFSSTIALSGLAVFEVEKIGSHTEIGKIGTSLSGIEKEESPLQKQIRSFVKGMAFAGVVVFLLVWGYAYLESRNLVESLLVGLTMAMSVLPEEIPVAFTTFMALGAWKLMKEDVIIKSSSIVETLGSTTVICTDKTGTITENSMHLDKVYDYQSAKEYKQEEFGAADLSTLLTYSMWASEPVPFDPMEKTLHRIYQQHAQEDRRKEFELFHEYPLGETSNDDAPF